MSKQNIYNKKRIFYLDILKTLSIFSIIVIHITLFWSQVEILNMPLVSISQMGRFAVPTFLMVSGVLLINRNYDSFKDFFIPKIVKITIPFLFWTIIIILLTFHYNGGGVNPLFTIFYSFFHSGILWYYWMIIGVYLTIPIINEYVKNKGLDGIRYFLIISIIASIIYQCCNFLHIETFIDFRFFISPILYILLGYYLHNKEFNLSPNKIILISALLFITFSLIKTNLNVIPYEIVVFTALNNYSFVDGNNIFFNTFLDVGIIEIIHTSSLFLFLKYLNSEKIGRICSYMKKNKISKLLIKIVTSISKSTWGIYCSQSVFLIILPTYTNNIHLSGTNTTILILALSFAVLIMGHLFSLITSKIPILNKISGYY